MTLVVIILVDDRLADRLVPEGLWEIVEPLIRRRRGVGRAGRRRVEDGRCSPRCVRDSPRGAPGGICRRRSESPRRRRTAVPGVAEAGLWAGCTGGPGSARRRRRAGLVRAIVDAASVGRKGGIVDGAEPGRPRQSRLQAARPGRAHRPAARRRRLSAATSMTVSAHPLVQAVPAIRSRAARAGDDQRNCTPTRPTTPPSCARSRGHAASPRGSPAAASSPANASAGTAGSSNPPCPGCSAAAGSPSATNAKPTTSSPSSDSPQPSPATTDSPNETSL